MKIFLTGASGMLGAEIIRKLSEENHELMLTDLTPRLEEITLLDVRDVSAVKKQVAGFKPDYVLHLAAETNVDLCEQDPSHAYRTNTEGTRNVVDACRDHHIPLVYISTSSVFPGDKETPYTESDQCGPVNVYAKSKWEGELLIEKTLKEYFIIRASWMIGGWALDKKFVYKIVSQLLAGKQELRVVADKFGTPTFTRDFANNILPLLNTGQYGIYHMGNKGTCSRHEMAEKIVAFMGLQDKVRVIPISSDDFPLPAPRPRSEMIINSKLDSLGLNHMPPWEDALQDYIETNARQANKL